MPVKLLENDIDKGELFSTEPYYAKSNAKEIETLVNNQQVNQKAI